MSRIADLAEELGARHGVDPGEMADYLVEQLERLTYRCTITSILDDPTYAELTDHAGGELREAIAEQFGPEGTR